jgi:methyl-accepting chemotaxis protein
MPSHLAFGPQTADIRTRVRKAIADMVHLQNRLKEEIVKEQNAAESHVRYMVVLLGIAGFVVGIGIAVMITRSITTVMTEMVGLVQDIANNNLATADLEITTQDETGQAGEALNRMKNNLRQIIQSIASTATHVASASEEISASATQQAQSSETQKDQTAHGSFHARDVVPSNAGIRQLQQGSPRRSAGRHYRGRYANQDAIDCRLRRRHCRDS